MLYLQYSVPLAEMAAIHVSQLDQTRTIAPWRSVVLPTWTLPHLSKYGGSLPLRICERSSTQPQLQLLITEPSPRMIMRAYPLVMLLTKSLKLAWSRRDLCLTASTIWQKPARWLNNLVVRRLKKSIRALTAPVILPSRRDFCLRFIASGPLAVHILGIRSLRLFWTRFSFSWAAAPAIIPQKVGIC